MEEQKLKNKALYALARREHSRFELKQKLAKLSKDQSMIEQILDYLEAQQWLSDARFAQAFISYRANRYDGPRKIRYELQKRGISLEIMEQAFVQTALDWPHFKEKARQRKFGEEKAASWIEEAKQAEYLYQRGFEVF